MGWDITMLNTRNPHLAPVHHPESRLVYAVGGADGRVADILGRVAAIGRDIQVYAIST